MKKIFYLFMIIFCLPMMVNFAQNDWPMARGNSFINNYAQNENELAPPFIITDKITTYGSEFSFKDQLLVIGRDTDPNSIAAFDWTNGNESWLFEIPNTAGSIGCIPAISESLVLTGGQQGNGLYAVDKSTGQQVWFYPVGSMYYRNPIIYGDKVFVITDSLYCINLSDGKRVWTFPAVCRNTPAVDENNLYIPGEGFVLDKLTGQIKWQFFGQTGFAPIVIDENNIYHETSDSLFASNKNSGAKIWSVAKLGGDINQDLGGGIAVSDQYICYTVWQNIDSKAEIYVFNKSTGNYIWHYTFNRDGILSPRIANDFVYAVHFWSAHLWGFKLSDGSVILHDSTATYIGNPIIADHSLIVPTTNGVRFFKSSLTVVEDEKICYEYKLSNNYPNPFNPSTTINYSLPEREAVSIKVFDILGREISVLVNEEKPAGNYSVEFSSSRIPSGVYFYEMTAGKFRQIKKMIILK
ncbi:MAG: PQQ-binding-like beta-propeller repeat protein [bacterium]